MPPWAESLGAHADWSKPGILCDLSQKASLGSIVLGLRGREAAPGGVVSQQTLLRALKLGAFSMTHLPPSMGHHCPTTVPISRSLGTGLEFFSTWPSSHMERGDVEGGGTGCPRTG